MTRGPETVTLPPPDQGRPDGGPESGQIVAGRFVLGRKLGAGGSGVVHAAWDLGLGQHVAVKILHPHVVSPASVARLRREVRVARSPHPSLVTVHDLHEGDGLHLLSMELLDGTSLRDRLEADGALTVEHTLRAGRHVAAALAHLHAAGVVHRDVKPGNIFLLTEGTVKLLDMGLARPLEHGHTVTDTEMAVGTPAFMAPEQARGAELSPAADIYSLGLTLHQCLTGKVPLVEETAVSTLVRRQRERPPRARRLRRSLPRWLDRLIAAMLEPQPGMRPSAARVVRALDRATFGWRPRPRRLAAGLLALSVAGGAWLARERLWHGETVRMELTGQDVRGLDGRGRVTWRRPLTGNICRSLRADLDGDGEAELVVGTASGAEAVPRGTETPASEIMAIRRDGTVVTSVQPERRVAGWSFPYPKRLRPYPEVLDVDGDGWQEIVGICRQTSYYPCTVVLYWPRWDRWQHVLSHPGHLQAVTPVPGAEVPALRFLAINNRLGLTMVMGELEVPQPTGSGPLVGALQWAGVLPALQAYVLLPAEPPPPGARRPGYSIESLPAGGTLCRVGDLDLVLDRYGNLADGPNVGRDLRDERRAFLVELQQLSAPTPRRADLVAQAIREAEARFADLLGGNGYRAAFSTAAARALARAGDAEAGVRLLGPTASRVPFDDVHYHLAHLQALAGRLEQAETTLRAMVEVPRTPRAGFDAVNLLLRVLVERGDRPAATAQALRVAEAGTDPRYVEGLRTAVLARAHVWWDEISEADRRTTSWSREPAGAALACLARWRSGRLAPDDVEAMRRTIEQNPDARLEGRLALAAAQLGLGRPEDAVATLEGLMTQLEPASRDSFGNHQVLDLARAVRSRALLAAGQADTARQAARALLPELTPGLLPAHLAEEVLAATAADPEAG